MEGVDNAEGSSVHIHNLPRPVLFEHIFACLDPKSLNAVFRTCKMWSYTALHQTFWKQATLFRVKDTNEIHKPDDKDWLWVYKSKTELDVQVPNYSGVCRIYFEKGKDKQSRYEGDLLEGKKEGFGVWVTSGYPTEFTYIGFFTANQRHGKGKIISEGSEYYGDWKEDEKHGNGRYSWQSGSIYEGEFSNGYRQGNGVYIWKDGDHYQGQFKENKFHGVGVYTWSDGSSYSGEWYDNHKAGKGIFRWPDGAFYEGEWKHNKREGYGKFMWKDGSSFEGDYKNNKQIGKGVYTWANGNRYEGDFFDGKCHGVGKFYEAADGWVIDEQWKEDMPLNIPNCLSPVIREALQYQTCTYFYTGNEKYAQVFYRTREMDEKKSHGLCAVCVKVCAPRNGIYFDSQPRFAGNFYCDCGSQWDSRFPCFAAPHKSPSSSLK